MPVNKAATVLSAKQRCLGRPAFQEVWVDEELFPENFFTHPAHLHHCHKTGLTLGAVHPRCNAILWQHYGK